VTSGETLSRARGGGPAAGVTGVVVVVHGGQSVSTAPTSALQLAVLRMVPVAQAIRHRLRGSGAVVCRPRLLVRGWNGEKASPVADLSRVLDQIGASYGPAPIVLVGHSMGARAAFHVAGHPAVSAVAGLAPWLPPGEPVGQLAGRRVLALHLPVSPSAREAEVTASRSSRSKHSAPKTETASTKPPATKSAEIERLQTEKTETAVVRHKVKSGETLYSIATFYNTTVAALKRDNRNVVVLRPGMILTVQAAR